MRLNRVGFIVAIIILLCACSNSQSGPLPTSTRLGGSDANGVELPTVSPLYTPNPDCKRPALEAWLERSSVFSAQFMTALRSATGSTREQVPQYLDQMGTYYTYIRTTPRPQCAEEHYAMIQELQGYAIQMIRDYSKGGGIDLAALSAATENKYQQILLKQNELQAAYDAMPLP